MAITLISTVTVGAGGAASIDFTSIPGTYTDLMVVLSGRSSLSGRGNNVFCKFNNDSATASSSRWLNGDGSTASSSSDSGGTSGILIRLASDGSTETANTFSNVSIIIPNYAGSTNKSLSADTVTEDNFATAYQAITAGLWPSTAAISRVTLTPQGNTWLQYSSASLYGITKGSSSGVTVS